MYECMCVWRGEEGLWGQEVLPRHVKGDSQPGYNLGGRRRWGRGRVGGERWARGRLHSGEGQGSPGVSENLSARKQGLSWWVWAVVRVQGQVVPWLAPGCLVFIGDADYHGGHGLPLSPIPGLCLLGITVSVTKSLLSWGWQGARLSSSR